MNSVYALIAATTTLTTGAVVERPVVNTRKIRETGLIEYARMAEGGTIVAPITSTESKPDIRRAFAEWWQQWHGDDAERVPGDVDLVDEILRDREAV